MNKYPVNAKHKAIETTIMREDLYVEGDIFKQKYFRLICRRVPETGERVIHLILPPNIEEKVIPELRKTPPKFARLYRSKTNATLMFDDGSETPFALGFGDDTWFGSPVIPKISNPVPCDGVRLAVNLQGKVAMILYCIIGGDGSEKVVIPQGVDINKPLSSTLMVSRKF